MVKNHAQRERKDAQRRCRAGDAAALCVAQPLGLNDPHFGCGLAQCGACTACTWTVSAVRSCVLPVVGR